MQEVKNSVLIIADGILFEDSENYHFKMDLHQEFENLSLTVAVIEDFESDFLENQKRRFQIDDLYGFEAIKNRLREGDFGSVILSYKSFKSIYSEGSIPFITTIFFSMNIWDDDFLEFSTPLPPLPQHKVEHIVGIRSAPSRMA